MRIHTKNMKLDEEVNLEVSVHSWAGGWGRVGRWLDEEVNLEVSAHPRHTHSCVCRSRSCFYIR